MLIPSKLSRPARLQTTVVREQLLTRLDAARNYRLVLVNGPAGYGKTTLMAQWAQEKAHLGWYSLDESDNQPERFAHYLIAAIQQATGGQCAKSEAMSQKHQYATLSALFAQLFIELADWPTPLYLVIDDYHLISHPQVHEAMRFFLRHQPDNLTLCLMSRTLPPLGIANLRVREQLLEINTRQLAFNHLEAGQFFHQRLNTPLADDEMYALCDEVEGWPTALQLIALSARQSSAQAQASARRLARINATHLADYLADEVLDRVDDDTRRFLLCCSVLRSMNDALICALTGEEEGQQRLEELERQGLFIHRMDGEGEWFCFHPLFAHFLRNRCQREMATALPQLHRRAAQGWLSQGFPAEAIHHAQAAGDMALLCDILLQHAWSLFHQCELALLESCLNTLPYDALIQHPSLALLQAWLAQSQHRYSEVNTLLARAEQEMALRQITLDAALHAEFNALRAQVAINDGRPDDAERLATEALRYLPIGSYYSRIVSSSVLGEVLHCKGMLARALPMMQQTEQVARRHQAYHYALWALLQQSEILIAQGFLQAAYETQDKAFELVEEQHLQQLPMHEFLLRIRAQVLWSWMRLDDAERAAREGLAVLANFEPQQQLQCLALLAKCSLARGDLDNAGQHLRRCEALLQSGNYHSDWLVNADKARVIYWQITGDRQAAGNWLLQAVRPAAPDNHFLQGQWRNIARVQIMLGQYEEAQAVLEALNGAARRLRLVSDLNRNLLLSNLLYWHMDRKSEALRVLMEALSLANRTGFVSHFVIEGEVMAQQLRQLLQLNTLPELEVHRAQRILRDINQHHRHKFAHFDEKFVERLLNHPQVPELIRTSPLTQREWQVLGLIYSGYSNEQIADELAVAATTIKTHIRNLYQKLGVTHRQEAVRQAQDIMRLMGYGV
ncbi:HTH-type transcriptional regulator MalT [Edwardsiella tarda]|uniref:HTH-type transcriptional regulator MalT n=1 Tax=Edwardsiella tarda TaxID=636 RepID=A0A2A7TYZ0_EDWTA|nr:HTH-type transcriptional regulator MalT [Edwardsiella tarda]PEH71366.1 HTH-type transcriptional regulator MalT [Edwardsiella tarda]